MPARLVTITASDACGLFTVAGWVDGRPVIARAANREVCCTRELWERARPHFAPEVRPGSDSGALVVVDSARSRTLTAMFLVFVRACDLVTVAELRSRSRASRSWPTVPNAEFVPRD